MTREETIKTIKANLKRRSGKDWSVTGGRGTTYGWLTISVPPRHQNQFGYMPEADRHNLTVLLGLTQIVDRQGVSIPDSNEYRQEYVDRSAGKKPTVIGTRYWD